MSAKTPNEGDAAEGTLGLEAFHHLPAEAGLSLNQLGEALAGMLRSGDDPYDQPAAAGPGEPEGEVEAESAEPDEAFEVTPRTILEALLFVGHPQNEPITSKQVAGLMRGVRPAEIDALVRELNRDYAARNCPYAIAAEGAGYRMMLRDEFGRLRDKFYGKARQARLSQAAIEVLSAVAYNQPITAEEVSRLRGTPCGHVLLQLVRRQLLRVEPGEGAARQRRYHTTDRFLELFGLASLDDLPRSTDLEES